MFTLWCSTAIYATTILNRIECTNVRKCVVAHAYGRFQRKVYTACSGL